MDLVLPRPGTYVVAVSGGVDSMALLHRLQRERAGAKDWKLVVAHLDHGIRTDSGKDRDLVQAVAKEYDIPFVFHEGRLGPGTSEAKARLARYEFLRSVQQSAGARAIITAHHQDDVLETAIINIIRGTGRKGLTSLGSRPDLLRPLLQVPKPAIIAYARDQGLVWREDSTNTNEAYLRNYVRHRIVPRLSSDARSKLVAIVTSLTASNQALDEALAVALQAQPDGRIERFWFNHLPHAIAREVMAAWLRAHDVRDFDSKTLERLVVAAKVAAPGKVFPVRAGCMMQVFADYLALTRQER